MNNLVELFANNILPIFILAGVGFLAGKYLQVTPRPLSQVTFYIFSPCLIFNLVTTGNLTGNEALRMVVFTTIIILGTGILAWILATLFRLQRRIMVAVILSVMFGNTGAYGLSLNLFSFGESALAYASLYFITTAILLYTIGAAIASLGKSDLKSAMVAILKVPTVYAVILALLFNKLGWQLPLPLERSVSLLGDASIPVLLVLMGIQLQAVPWGKLTLAFSMTNILRLVASPLMAVGLSVILGLTGAARQAGILESAMPSAIFIILLATEYDIEPSFVTSVVFSTTLLSPLTLTPLLAYLSL